MVTRGKGVAALVAHRLLELGASPWLIGLVSVLTLTLGALVATSARGLSEQEDLHSLELQIRLDAGLKIIGPTGLEADRALRILRPPSKAAVVIAGREASIPAGWDIGPGSTVSLPSYALASQTHGGPGNGGDFLGQFGALLSLALGLTIVLQDRERGWSDALRATSASAGLVLMADLLALCLVLAVVVGAWFGAVWLMASQILPSDWPDAAATLAALAPVTWLYLVAFCAYGAAIGWYARGSLKAVTGAVAVWMGLVLLAPQMVSSWSTWEPEMASLEQAEQARRDTYLDRVREVEDRWREQIAVEVGSGHSTSVTNARAQQALNASRQVWEKGMAEARAMANASEDEWRTEADGRARDFRRVARFVPSTLLSQVLADIAGTGELTQKRWEAAVLEHKRRLDRVLFDDRPSVILAVPFETGPEYHGLNRHPTIPYKELPQFVPPNLELTDRWRASRGDVLILALHALLGLGLAALAQRRAWRRYDFAL